MAATLNTSLSLSLSCLCRRRRRRLLELVLRNNSPKFGCSLWPARELDRARVLTLNVYVYVCGGLCD